MRCTLGQKWSIFSSNSRLLQTSAINRLKNQWEQQATQILTIFMLSPITLHLAGFMLTGNRSMFLKTDDSLAWLCHFALVHSPLHALNQCFDRIPIVYEGQIQFVDTIARQTYAAPSIRNC